MPHPPVLRLGDHRLTEVGATTVCDVPLIVVVAHQCADVPTDLAAEAGNASHCFCTSFSAGVAINRDGPKIFDGKGCSADSGRQRPRIERTAISTDGGATFTNRTTADGLGNDYVYGLYVDGGGVYAATAGGLRIGVGGGNGGTKGTGAGSAGPGSGGAGGAGGSACSGGSPGTPGANGTP